MTLRVLHRSGVLLGTMVCISLLCWDFVADMCVENFFHITDHFYLVITDGKLPLPTVINDN